MGSRVNFLGNQTYKLWFLSLLILQNVTGLERENVIGEREKNDKDRQKELKGTFVILLNKSDGKINDFSMLYVFS